MLYLVQGEVVDPGMPLSAQQFAEFVDSQVIPTFERLTKLEAEGTVRAGGAPAGARATAFIVDAASNDELTGILMSLPLWSRVKWQVTPLDGFQQRINLARQLLERVKATLQ
jgi:muconolactone delta-isomerase